MLNTTSGPVQNPHHPQRHPAHTLNTSGSVYEEPSEIISVVPATGYYAEFKDGTRTPLLVFVVTEEGDMYGTALTEDGSIDLTYDVSQRDDFARYATNKAKEK